MNAAECLLSVGATDAIALTCGDHRMTYGALRARVACAADAWSAAGLGGGDRVIVFAADSIDWVIAYLGVIWAGGVAIGVNPKLSLADLASIVAESEIAFIWCDPETTDALSDMAAASRSSARIVAVGARNGVDWARRLRDAAPISPTQHDPDEPAFWIGTSGTTGTPKGVIHAHRAAMDPHSFAQHVLHVVPGDRLYATSKLFFAYSFANSLFAGFRSGATVILDRERASPERVREMVERHRPTILFTVPTLYNRMLHDGVAPALRDSTIRAFVSAGEALPQRIRQGWLQATGKAPISGYGTSETLCLVLYSTDPSGLLAPTPLTEVRTIDGTDWEAPQRIWLKNPTLALGYWHRPEAQADAFCAGWFSPADMFLRRPEGLEFAGRSDDLLKISGQWVSTLWVEHALSEAGGEAIEHVAAVGAPTDQGLTAIAVMIVARDGREDVARQRIAASVRDLPMFRRPQWVHWVNDLPQTATGKLQRSALRAVHEHALRARSNP